MRITAIDSRRVKIKLYEPFKVAFGEIALVENVLVRVSTDEGIKGYGEAAPLAFVTGETAEGVTAALELLRGALIGRNPLAVDDIHALMNGILQGNSSARCAVDLAIYDIRGKVMGRPVYQVLGGASGMVQNDVTIGMAAPEEMARRAEHYVKDEGYHILKVKAGIDPAEDLRALTLIREAVGGAVRLRVDANQGYDLAAALWILEKFAALGVEAAEQCLPAWDLEGAAYLRARAPGGIRLMLDESVHGPRDAARSCKLGAADIFNIKLMKCGGLYPAEQIGAIAGAYGLSCMVGCMLETRLAICAGLSLAAAKGNIKDADCDSFLYYDPAQTGVSGGFTVEKDMFRLSDDPGFGVDVDF